MKTQTRLTVPTEEKLHSPSEVKPPAVELSVEAALLRPSIAGAMDIQQFSKGLYCTG